MSPRPGAVGFLVVGVAIVGAWLLAGGDGIEEKSGAQIRSPEVSIGDAQSHNWSVLENEIDTRRPDFPRSMIAMDSQICFGFERLDFGAPARPSLARCVEREALRSLRESSIASTFVVRTGLDTWHVIVFGAPFDSVMILGDGNVELPAGRIFVGDGVIALRLPNDMEIESMSWTVGRSRYSCRPASDVVDSGRFCR